MFAMGIRRFSWGNKKQTTVATVGNSDISSRELFIVFQANWRNSENFVQH